MTTLRAASAPSSTVAVLVGAMLTAVALACSEDPAPSGPEPLFPADYASSYVEVRDCRLSIEHDLTPIRVLADPQAAAVYQSREGDFATGAIVLKEEFDASDPTCSGPVQRWTVMVRDVIGSSPETLDWQWQEVLAEDRRVENENEARCITCHTRCGVPPEGFLATCTAPPNL